MSAQLQARALELVWRHWTALGISSSTTRPEQAVDLEALIAFTPFVSSKDPRLEREVIDWCTRIGPRFVSISRLRQLYKLMSPSEPKGSNLLAELLLAWTGKRSAPTQLSMKSRSPRLEQDCLVQLRARHIFGVGARADVVTALVMRASDAEGVRISDLGVVGYSKPAVATVMDELSDAGVLDKHLLNRAARYKLVKGAPMRALLAPLPKRAPRWPERFALIARVLDAWEVFGTRSTYGIELAKLLEQLRPLAAAIEMTPPTRGKPAALVDEVDRWANKLLDG